MYSRYNYNSYGGGRPDYYYIDENYSNDRYYNDGQSYGYQEQFPYRSFSNNYRSNYRENSPPYGGYRKTVRFSPPPPQRMIFSRRAKEGVARRFFRYLKDNSLVDNRSGGINAGQLKNIYMKDFRPDFGGRTLPTFSSVLWGLIQIRVAFYTKDGIKIKEREGGQQSMLVVDQHISKLRAQRDSYKPLKVEVNNEDEDSGVDSPRKEDAEGYCTICGITPPEGTSPELHKLSKTHQRIQVSLWYNQNKRELLKDKNGLQIKIEEPEDVEEVYGSFSVSTAPKEGLKVKVAAINTDEEKTIVIKRIMFLYHEKSFSVDKLYENITLPPGEKTVVEVNCLNSTVGFYQIPLAFQMDYEEKLIYMVKILGLNVQTEDIKELKPTSDYTPPPRISPITDVTDTVPGQPPPGSTVNLMRVSRIVREYNVPHKINKLLNHGLKEYQDIGDQEKEDLQQLNTLLHGGLSYDEYTNLFSTLLYMEEHQMMYDIRRYDLTNAEMTRRGKLLELNVPSLCESRPSVLRGDKVYVRIKKDDDTLDSTEYEGIIHEVRETKLRLGFSMRLMKNLAEGMKFDVRFTFIRTPLQMSHRAVELAKVTALETLLFPTLESCLNTADLTTDDIIPYNRQIEQNPEQLAAVKNVVNGTYRPAPYIIYGPPGTGKTVTIVESIKQVWRYFHNCRIIATGPSNAVVDLLTRRLLEHIPKRHILRIHAASRDWNSVPSQIQNVSNYNFKEGCYYYPSLDELCNYKIILCTLVTAGRLVTAQFPPKHFSHVFVDEAGNSLEPESIIPIAGILLPHMSKNHAIGGHVVLAGDPKQLGAIVRSPLAEKYQLGKSLLERLMERDLYKKDSESGNYNVKFITKLKKNYRSHPDIINVSNKLFYDNELEACADETARTSLCSWEGLVTANFPVVMHAVSGRDQREASSPSFFNPQEVSVVLEYVDKLLENKTPRVRPEHIGIIAPYRRQVQKIQGELRKRNIEGVTVGSTEEFQGQERRIIIISTVRSSADYLNMDKQFQLGFLENPKRFNVAVTRAKALLVVVGNPRILCLDPSWKELITFTKSAGGYKGDDFNVDEEVEIDDIIQDLCKCTLESGGEVKTEKEAQEQPPWKGEQEI